jgi:hypothetical protein
MYSIFHFWKSLVDTKLKFNKVDNLDKFPFQKSMFSCENKGLFPDFAIKLNKNNPNFSGGELLELKDSKAYNVSSFNSTIPTGKKNIKDIVLSPNSKIFKQMTASGDDIFSLEIRDVYYLVRGKKNHNQKICLVYGSFFETIPAKQLIGEAFSQVLDEAGANEIDEDTKNKLKEIFSKQDSFSSVRNIEKASVNLRFRVMTEVKLEANILNSTQYPEISDNTLNLVYPFYSDDEKQSLMSKMELAIGARQMNEIKVFPIKHPLNGWFLVFQTNL